MHLAVMPFVTPALALQKVALVSIKHEEPMRPPLWGSIVSLVKVCRCVFRLLWSLRGRKNHSKRALIQDAVHHLLNQQTASLKGACMRCCRLAGNHVWASFFPS